MPNGLERVEIELATATPNVDVDLFARFGADVTLSPDGFVVVDHRAEGPTGFETILITPSSSPPLRAGTYYIAFGLRTAGVQAQATVTARFISPPPPPPPTGGLLSSASPMDFVLPPLDVPTLFNGSSAYRIDVPANATSLEVEVFETAPSSAEIELFLRLDSEPFLADGDVVADAASVQPGGNDRIRLDANSQPPLRTGTYFAALGLLTLDTLVRGKIIARIETIEAPAPLVSQGGIVLGTGTPVVPIISANSIVTLFGTEFAVAGTLALEPQLDVQGKVATNLANTCVEINSERSPMFVVLPTQINLQASDKLAAGNGSVVVIRGCGTAQEQRSDPVGVLINPAAPGFFNFVNNLDGGNPIAALHGGGPELAGPVGLFAGVSTTPAKPGEFVSLFATGLGPTSPAFEAGAIPGEVAPVTGAVAVTIGGSLQPTSSTSAWRRAARVSISSS